MKIYEPNSQLKTYQRCQYSSFLTLLNNSKARDTPKTQCVKTIFQRFYDNKRKILNNLSIEILETRCFGIIGANGSGKTTIAGIISGMFLTQPFFVAEVFTGRTGRYVSIADTVKGFGEILDGKYDDLPEQAFYMVGSIDEAVEAAAAMRAG